MCRDGCVGGLCNISHKDNPKAIVGMDFHNRVVYAEGWWWWCRYWGAVGSGRQRTALQSVLSSTFLWNLGVYRGHWVDFLYGVMPPPHLFHSVTVALSSSASQPEHCILLVGIRDGLAGQQSTRIPRTLPLGVEPTHLFG